MTQLNIPLVVNNVIQAATYWPGGLAVLVGVGTWGTALYTVQILGPDGVTFINTTLATTGANGITATPLYMAAGKAQVVLTSGSGQTGIYLNMQAIPTNLN
jgi:hypothetical protein